MTAGRSLLRDVALVLLAVATVAGAAYVLTRTPQGTAPTADRVAPPSAEPTDAPTPQAIRALFIGGDLLAAPPENNLAALTAEQLGWDADVDAAPGSGYVTGPPGATLLDRVPVAVEQSDADVVVILSSAAETGEADPRRFGGNVQFVISAVREALPEARVVLVGPIAPTADALPVHRQILTDAAARFGAFFVDPTGRGYVSDQPELLAPDGTLTPEGAQAVAARLAADLRVVLPPTLVPSVAPTP